MPQSSSAHPHVNRLIHESSPYLQQHAGNPVDWYPWGPEAFQRAARDDKPIFLSVGYSACHWCHVMERESFEDPEIAGILNEHFVSIKVDREERPDVDQIYMSAVQLITRRGGWPMSIFMTATGKPFYGGTYWPPQARLGMPGFRDILLKLQDYWAHRREEVDVSADQLAEAIQSFSLPQFEQKTLSEEILERAMRSLIRSADRIHGGFGGAPKFPHPMDLRVLMRGWRRFGNEEALEVVLQTLTRMARGGIYDQLAGGFHRYATDARWLVPHFEKMLYDNALLVPAYLEAFQITQEQPFADLARGILDYVLREMTSPQGGFFSTQDADSEGEEGKYFVWTVQQCLEVLGPEDGALFNDCYDVTPAGNWEGVSILNRPRSLAEDALLHGLTPAELEKRLGAAREKLLAARRQRIAPGRDEKILTNWNGLMISALAMASQVLDEPRYCAAAIRASEFVLSSLQNADGRLQHVFKDGQARFQGYLDDYACLIEGLVETFLASGRREFLQAAERLAEQGLRHFQDQESGGFFFTADDHEELISRTKDSQDQATPSGNGMMATALFRLGRLSGRSEFEQAALTTLEFQSGLMGEHPATAGQSLMALDLLLGPVNELVIIDDGDETATQWARQIHQRFLPRKLFLRATAEQASADGVALLAGKGDSGPTRLYVCSQGTCESPIFDPEQGRQRIAAF